MPTRLTCQRRKRKRQRLYAKQHGRCFYCGLVLARGVRYGLDHLTPQAHGGRHSDANLVLACHRCNKAKGSMTLEEYRVHTGVSAFAGEATRHATG